MVYFYPMLIIGYQHYLQLNVRRIWRIFHTGQPVCYALIQDGSKNRVSAYYISGKVTKFQTVSSKALRVMDKTFFDRPIITS